MDKPQRKPTRLINYDYSAAGAYFITVCTKEHRCILGNIISVGDGVLDVPQMHLTDYGKAAKEQLEIMSSFYKDISIDKFVVMPNHIHLLVCINELGNGSSGMPTPTNQKISQFISSFKRFCNKRCGENIWQRSFYDHIIRDNDDHLTRWKYIEENPVRWANDKYYKTV